LCSGSFGSLDARKKFGFGRDGAVNFNGEEGGSEKLVKGLGVLSFDSVAPGVFEG
jgi:hypothetical protein